MSKKPLTEDEKTKAAEKVLGMFTAAYDALADLHVTAPEQALAISRFLASKYDERRN